MSDNMRNMKDSFEAARVSKALDDIVSSVEKFTDNARETEEELKVKAEKTEEQIELKPKIIEDMVEPEEPQYTKVRDAKEPIYPPIKKSLDNYSKLDIKGMPSNLIVIDDTNGEFKQTGHSWYFSVPDEHRLILDATAVHHSIPINNNDNYRFETTYYTMETHHFNPLWLAYYGEQINDLRVHDVVNLIMESFFKDYSSIDEAIMTMFVYYILEEDDDKLRYGFVPQSDDFNHDLVHIQPLDGGRCLSSILKLVQEAKVPYDEDEKSIFQIRLEDFFHRKPYNKTSHYYDTFLLTGYRIARETLLNIAASLHYFSCPNYDYITRTNFNPNLNLSVDNVLMQSQDTFYLDLVIPNKKIMNFLARAVQKMISQREKELNYEWFIGYCRQGKKKTEPYIKAVFGPFDCKEDAIQFYESATTDFISESGFKNGHGSYDISYDVIFKNKSCKQSFSRETLVQELEALNTKSGLEIWQGIY